MALRVRAGGAYDALCSNCLGGELYPTREAYEAAWWEERPDGQLWCLTCSRTRREVQPPTNARGVRMRRRRR